MGLSRRWSFLFRRESKVTKKIMVEVKKVKIIIRKVRVEDAKFISELSLELCHVMTENEAKERLAKIIKRRDQVIFVAEHVGERVLGYAYVVLIYELLNGNQARLEGLIVDDVARGMGLGQKLMKSVEAWAKKKGSKTLKFVSNIKRIEAHGFYEKISYEKSKIQQQFKKEL